MNRDYKNSMDNLQISEDFKTNTRKLMKEARTMSNKKSINKKVLISAASLALIFVAGGTAYHNLSGSNNIFNGTSQVTETNKGYTVPLTELPKDSSQVSAKMMPLFVYQGKVYLQSNTGFTLSEDGMTPTKEDILNLQGDYIGQTTGSLNEWSTQDDYAKELASTIGEAKIYTIKGYDSEYRLMAYYEWEGGYSCDIFDSFGGLTINEGSDYFNLLNLNGNVIALSYENFDSWNNGLGSKSEIAESTEFNNFIEALNDSTPVGNDVDLLLENQEADAQKFITITTKDNLKTTLRLVKGGYVYDTQVGFFKVADEAFNAFWNSLAN
ncbi:MAG: hypothetical protein K0S61_974 [Anaerocolumna sp.]|nr:hypothetical protein [Anaerocolumna sp.]